MSVAAGNRQHIVRRTIRRQHFGPVDGDTPVARTKRERTEAHQLLAQVYDWFTEGFDTPDLLEAKQLLATLVMDGATTDTSH